MEKKKSWLSAYWAPLKDRTLFDWGSYFRCVIWHMGKPLGFALALYGMMMSRAHATAVSPANPGPTDFGSIASSIWSVICKFIKSPIVGVIVAVAILALLVMMAVNEDKGMLSTILKILIAAGCIIGLPSIIGMFGFQVSGCA